MTTSLVTGGTGYFGSLLVRRLVGAGHRVRVLDINGAVDLGDDVGVADVADHDFDVAPEVDRGIDVEHADPMAGTDQSPHEQRSEVPSTSGDQAGGHNSSPCSTHQRMLLRIPSYNPTRGS